MDSKKESYEQIKARLAARSGQPELECFSPEKANLSCEVARIDAGASDLQVYEVNGGSNDILVLYLHGGWYANPMVEQQWMMLDEVIGEAKCRAIVPMYHLPPWGSCKDAYRDLVALYKFLRVDNPNSKVVFLGDSAGGGLALGLAEQLAADGEDMPDELLLISPWVDLNPSSVIEEEDTSEPFISCAQAKAYGEAWAGDLPVDDPRVSPLRGNLSGLPPTTIFVGMNEGFFSQIKELALLLQEASVKTKMHEGSGQKHIYPVYPIPEGDKARKEIIEELQRLADD